MSALTVSLVSALSVAALWVVPTPEAPRDLQATDVSPGLAGFIAIFAIVLVTVLLIIDMSRRIRRLRFRQRAAHQAWLLKKQAEEADDSQD